MPADTPAEPLDWNEANLCLVLSQIYAQALADQTFYDTLMAEPYQTLSGWIKVPDEYNGRVYARQKNKRMFVMNVPSPADIPPGGSAEAPVADFQILCTGLPPW